MPAALLPRGISAPFGKVQIQGKPCAEGGLFIYSITDFDSRVTVDVNFLLRQMLNTPEQLKSILEEIIAVPTGNNFITFEIKDIAPIASGKPLSGKLIPKQMITALCYKRYKRF